MGFLDKFKKKNEQRKEESGDKGSSEQPQSSTAGTTGRKIKKYTSDGKPVYE